MEKSKKTSAWASIEPYCVIRSILKNFWMVIVTALLFVMSVYLYQTVLEKPSYSCTTTFAVTSKTAMLTAVTNSSNSATTSAASQFAQLLQSSTLLNAAAEELEQSEFPAQVSATAIEGTNLVTMNVTAESPKLAYDSAVAILHNYEEYSQYIFNSVVMKPVTMPNVPTSLASQRSQQRLLLLSGPVGALVMIVVLALMNIFTGTVQTVTGARAQVDGELITSIQHERKNRTWKERISRQKRSLLISSPTTSFFYTETIHQIRTKLEHCKHRHGCKTFLFTSVSENEGKSTVAANVALSLAKKHKKVLLVDCDLRKPAQHLVFEQPTQPGHCLDRLLQQPLEPEALIHALQYRKQDNLFCLFSGSARRRAADLLASAQMKRLLEVLKRNFDYVILDSPPLGYFTDSEALADMADASVLVIRQDGITAVAANDAIDTLTAAKSRFVGYVLNDVHLMNPMGMIMLLGKKDGYGYGYGYGRKSGYGYGYGYGKNGESTQEVVRSENLQDREEHNGEE